MIVSEMSDLCLEVDCGMFGGVKEGQELETSKLDGKEQQLWYEDEDGQLRCKVEGYAVQSDGGKFHMYMKILQNSLLDLKVQSQKSCIKFHRNHCIFYAGLLTVTLRVQIIYVYDKGSVILFIKHKITIIVLHVPSCDTCLCTCRYVYMDYSLTC